MEKLTFLNSRGESIVFDGPPFYLVSVNGLGDVSATVQRQKAPYQDGSTRIGSTLEERVIPIEFLIVGENYSEVSEFRMKMGRVLNPNLDEGTLRYENGLVVREIKASAESVPFFPDGSGSRTSEMQKGLVTFVASNPFWKTAVDTVEQLVTFSGGLTFPLRLPTIFGNQDSQAKSRIVVNNGDSPTPIEITFEGPATTPIRIDNETTGEFIEVNQSLLEGEQLWISTAFGRKRVEKILADGKRINAFHHILVDPTGAGPSSTFFQLQPGNNLMTYNTGVEYEKAPVTIRFQPRYLAI
ncbi:phage tail family protein [Sporosarcina sp. SAFN-010]|uniref:phage tail family protein n=1 Tax=Sporosarcina sp. SAFN-010 TaxID=3387273 RepID=UPI003F7FABC6